MGIDLSNKAKRDLKIAEGLIDLEDKASVNILATQLADISKLNVLKVPLDRTRAFAEKVACMQQIISSVYKINSRNPIALERLFSEVLTPLSDPLPIGDDKSG